MGVAFGHLNLLQRLGTILREAACAVALWTRVGAGANSAVEAGAARGVTGILAERPVRPLAVDICSKQHLAWLIVPSFGNRYSAYVGSDKCIVYHDIYVNSTSA